MRLYHDNSSLNWGMNKDIKLYAEKFGKIAGVTGHPKSKAEMYLIKDAELSAMDTDNLKHYRYFTNTVMVSNSAPAVQIDLTTGKIHFLSRMGVQTDTFIFERRGSPLEYLRLL